MKLACICLSLAWFIVLLLDSTTVVDSTAAVESTTAVESSSKTISQAKAHTVNTAKRNIYYNYYINSDYYSTIVGFRRLAEIGAVHFADELNNE